MADNKKLVVLAPYITARVPDASGGEVISGFYAGTPLPANVNAEDRERLLRKEMVAVEGSTEADLLAVPAGTPIPGEPPNVPVSHDDLVGRTHQDRLARLRDVADATKKNDSRTSPPAKADETTASSTRASARAPKDI